MNPLTGWSELRWNQLTELEDLQHSLRSLFSRSLVHWPKAHQRLCQWIPLVNVSENARGYVLKAELPQVNQEDVKVTIEDGTLTIAGNRKFDQNSKKGHRVEHAYGRFVHSFAVPADARPADVSALFNNGVLIVHLAKNDKARRQQVEGNVSLAGRVQEANGFALTSHPRTPRFPESQNVDKNKNENDNANIPGKKTHRPQPHDPVRLSGSGSPAGVPGRRFQ